MQDGFSILYVNGYILPYLTNPSVKRSLTELRKVVNAVIRKYGLPETIRVELSRTLKKGKKVREILHQKMLENRSAREKAEEALLKEACLSDPSPVDILKYRLWKECGGICPYSGDSISMGSLFGPHPQFDIEHIYPRSRSLDDSFANKTLCRKDYNLRKGKQIPFDAFSTNADEWNNIVQRVQRFTGSFAKEKLDRFKSQKIPNGFANRMLNDNSIIATEAVKYLACLYGGIVDQDGSLRDVNERDPDDKRRGKLRVQVVPGQATARLRQLWKLNAILGPNRPEDKKYRADHRHHAIDALVIAHCTPAIVKKLAEESEKADEEKLHDRKYSISIPEPQDNFVMVVRSAVDKINVSFRANRKVSGGFHKGSNYSNPQFVIEGEGKKAKKIEYRYIRKEVKDMTMKDIEAIVDPKVREIVLKKLEDKDIGGDPKKFSDKKNLPRIDGKRKIPIRKARIRDKVGTMTVGKNGRERHVASGNNHHMEVVEFRNKKGKVEWDCKMVTMFDAYQRCRRHEPIICRDHGQDTEFVFSLAKDEYIQRKEEDGTWSLWRIHGLTGNKIKITRHNDARPSAEVEKESGTRPAIGTLRERIRKVKVDVLGKVHPAND